ncbi:hypothetical protein QWZ06_26530 [Chryseobacterium tructae]|uniref:hypothetical protein n=1 Tax=Chryseobacterium tructae TaxID=1037380 RepID=UPI0025B38999|nr:hypothetical protein [Chryseobacterium tructae]MDN3695530.1 hypothetical protein [Chryseobacterium tructae]
MKKFIISMMLMVSGSVFSQVSIGTPVQENNKWTFGGGIGLGFGSNSSLPAGFSKSRVSSY